MTWIILLILQIVQRPSVSSAMCSTMAGSGRGAMIMPDWATGLCHQRSGQMVCILW